MLVLSRTKDETVIIRVAGHIIKVTVVEGLGKIRLGFSADNDVKINRAEIDAAIHGKEARK